MIFPVAGLTSIRFIPVHTFILGLFVEVLFFLAKTAKSKYLYPKMIDAKTRHRRFADVYRSGGWSGLGSGPGSEVGQAGPFFDTLSGLFATYSIKTILDVGCGQGLVLEALRDFKGRYVGIDIVAEIIEQNRLKFPAPNIEFRIFDAAQGRLNDQFDLAIVKDTLQHLSLTTIARVMNNVAKMCDMAFVVNDSFCGKGIVESDIEDGGYRPLSDISKISKPFSLFGHVGDYSVNTGGKLADVKSMFLLKPNRSEKVRSPASAA